MCMKQAGVQGGQKGVSDFLELELQVVMSLHVAARKLNSVSLQEH